MPAYFCKKTTFFGKNSTFTQSNSVRAVLETFRSIFSFCKIKGYYLWKCKFYRLYVRNPASGLLQSGHKSEKWQWPHNLPRYDVIVKCFWRCFVSLVKFSCWSKFHVNIITGFEGIDQQSGNWKYPLLSIFQYLEFGRS